MLIDLRNLVPQYDLKITGVLHIGAHIGEEQQVYDEVGVPRTVWIEANPELIVRLQSNTSGSNRQIIQACVAEEDGRYVDFNVANNGQSSSLLEFGTHAWQSPDVVYVDRQSHHTVTVDTLAKTYGPFDDLNFLNIDLQGAELMALNGAIEYLKTVDYAYLEINREPLYIGCPMVEEIDRFLKGNYGLRRVETHWTTAGWGDGFYIKAS